MEPGVKPGAGLLGGKQECFLCMCSTLCLKFLTSPNCLVARDDQASTSNRLKIKIILGIAIVAIVIVVIVGCVAADKSHKNGGNFLLLHNCGTPLIKRDRLGQIRMLQWDRTLYRAKQGTPASYLTN